MYNIRYDIHIIYLQIYNGISKLQRSVNKTNKWRVRIIFVNLPPLLFCLSITLIGRKSDIDIESKDIYRIYIHIENMHIEGFPRADLPVRLPYTMGSFVVVVAAIVIACAWRVLPCNYLDNN